MNHVIEAVAALWSLLYRRGKQPDMVHQVDVELCFVIRVADDESLQQ